MPENYTDDNIHELILMSCTKILFGEAATEIGKKIFANSTLDEKLKSFIEFAKERSEYSPEYGQLMIRGLFNRFKISLNADKIQFEKLKNSSMTFCKPSEVSINEINEDYGLNEFCEEKIEIKIIEGDHVSMLSNIKLAEEILKDV